MIASWLNDAIADLGDGKAQKKYQSMVDNAFLVLFE